MCVDAVVSLERAAQAEAVFVAVPPDATISVLERVMEIAAPGTVVTDCASVKSEIAAWALDRRFARLVPGHPMAGHEKGGAAFASAWMFRGARWILTPTAATAGSSLKIIEGLVRAMGAQPVRIDAAGHDRHVATISHLPHVLAAALVQMGESLDLGEATGGSWKDMTRVGGVDPDLWTQIMMGNRHELAQVVRDYEGILTAWREALEKGDRAALHTQLEKAKMIKEKGEPKETARVARRVRR